VSLLPDQRVGREGCLLRASAHGSVGSALATDAELDRCGSSASSQFFQSSTSCLLPFLVRANEAPMHDRALSQHAGCDPVATDGHSDRRAVC